MCYEVVSAKEIKLRKETGSQVKFQLGQLEKALLKGSIYIKIFLNVRGTEWRENIVVGC